MSKRTIILFILLFLIIAALAAYYGLRYSTVRAVKRKLDNAPGKIEEISSLTYGKISVDLDGVVIENISIRLSADSGEINVAKALITGPDEDISALRLNNVEIHGHRCNINFCDNKTFTIDKLVFNGIDIKEGYEFLHSSHISKIPYSIDWFVGGFDLESVEASGINYNDDIFSVAIPYFVWQGNLKKGELIRKSVVSIPDFNITSKIVYFFTNMHTVKGSFSYVRTSRDTEFDETYYTSVPGLFESIFRNKLGNIDLEGLLTGESGILSHAKIEEVVYEYLDEGLFSSVKNVIYNYFNIDSSILKKSLAKNYLKHISNRDKIIDELDRFIDNPVSLKISLRPLVVISYSDMTMASPEIFNQLGISVSVNGGEKIYLAK